MASTLVTGRKFHMIQLRALTDVRVPMETRTWCPISHSWLVDTVLDNVSERGWFVRGQNLKLSQDGMEFFGVLDLTRERTGLPNIEGRTWDMSVGLRNTNNKRASAGVFLGSKVWVCDNLQFGSEHTLLRKHHRHSYDVLADGINHIIKELDDVRAEQAAFFCQLKNVTTTRQIRNDVVVQLADKGAIKVTDILRVVQEHLTPCADNVEASYGNLWGLYNACTWVSKSGFGLNPVTAAQRSLTMNKVFQGAIA